MLVATCLGLAALAATSCSKEALPDKPVLTGSTPGAAGTGSTGSTPNATATSGTVPGVIPNPGGTTPGTAASILTAGCPERTALRVKTNSGDKTLGGGTSWADVTLDSSAQILLTSFEAPSSQAGSIAVPSLTGSQLSLSLYLTATQGGKLRTGDYLSVGANPNAPLQLNSITLYSSAGREIVAGFSKPDQKVTITQLDDKVVCGTVDTNEATGSFVAKRV